jgi:hypothetical protein
MNHQPVLAVMLMAMVSTSATAGDGVDPCQEPDLTTQKCEEIGGGMVRCSGRRQMCSGPNGTNLHLRDLEIRTEPLVAFPAISVTIESHGTEFVHYRSSAQPVNSGGETQVVIGAQTKTSAGSTEVVFCDYSITGKRVVPK